MNTDAYNVVQKFIFMTVLKGAEISALHRATWNNKSVIHTDEKFCRKIWQCRHNDDASMSRYEQAAYFFLSALPEIYILRTPTQPRKNQHKRTGVKFKGRREIWNPS